ncbi:hypothetical protein P7C73_g136, partial [Tremellales sp. Uapishka_1]
MRSLLDLSNETLLRVSEFVGNDDWIPTPAFYPHWKNVAPEIQRGRGKSLRSFRNVNQTLRKLLPVPPLHVVIETVSQWTSWAWEAPEEIIATVKYLRIDCPNPDSKREDYRTNFSIFAHLLFSLPALEELHLARLPFCTHKDGSDDRKCVRTLSLPTVRSLAVSRSCSECYNNHFPLLLASAPNIQHLKCYVSTYSAEDLDSAFSKFRRINKAPTIPLETLIMNVDCMWDIVSHSNIISSSCPDLRELHLSPYTRSRHGQQEGLFRPQAFLEYIQIENSDVNLGSEISPEDDYLAELQEAIPKFKNLKIIDLGIAVEVTESRRQAPRTAERGMSARDLDAVLKSARKFGSPGNGLKASREVAKRLARRHAAETLVRLCPTLEQGLWWTSDDDNDNDPYPNRGMMLVSWAHTSVDGGLGDIEQEDWGFVYTPEFTKSSEKWQEG